MSLESAVKFLKRFNGDNVFRSALEALKDDATRKQMIKAAGFDFSQDELNHIVNQPTELSNGDLEAVAGGVEERPPIIATHV